MTGPAVSLRPDKCYAFALGDCRSRGGSSYGAFDPGLEINNEAIKFLGDSLHKFLGRLLSIDVTNKGAYKITVEIFSSALTTVDAAPITGPSKAWIYQFYILAVISWPFLIYPFSVSAIQKDFEAPAVRFLKKWYGLAKPANPAILFLPKSRNGLGLTSPVDKFKSLQVSALHQLHNSSDPLIATLAKSAVEHDSRSNSKQWKPATALSDAENILDFNLSFGGQTSSAGLGAGSSRGKLSLRERRSAIVDITRGHLADARVSPLRESPLSGNFLKWDSLIPSIPNWNHQIRYMSGAEVSFTLNAQTQSLPDPPTSVAGAITPMLSALSQQPPLSMFLAAAVSPYFKGAIDGGTTTC